MSRIPYLEHGAPDELPASRPPHSPLPSPPPPPTDLLQRWRLLPRRCQQPHGHVASRSYGAPQRKVARVAARTLVLVAPDLRSEGCRSDQIGSDRSRSRHMGCRKRRKGGAQEASKNAATKNAATKNAAMAGAQVLRYVSKLLHQSPPLRPLGPRPLPTYPHISLLKSNRPPPLNPPAPDPP